MKTNNAELSFSKATGKLMYSFDDDEPVELATIYDYAEVEICLKQTKMPKKQDIGYFNSETLNTLMTCIEFKSGDKTFKLFIKDINKETKGA